MVPVRNGNYSLTVVGEEYVIVPEGTFESGELYVIDTNETGAEVFKLINGIRSDEDIAHAIAEMYNVPFESAYPDVVNAIRSFCESSLVSLIP